MRRQKGVRLSHAHLSNVSVALAEKIILADHFPLTHGKGGSLKSGQVVAASRLHFNSIDLSGRFGVFGIGLGLTIRCPRVVLSFRQSEQLSATGDQSERALLFASRIQNGFGLLQPIAVTVQEAIPAHVGLGSGTQLALATATALLAANDEIPDNPKLALAAQFAQRPPFSGVGLASFQGGGFVVDSGYTINELERGRLPSCLVRLPFPEEWRILVVLPNISEPSKPEYHNTDIQSLVSRPPDTAESAQWLAYRVLASLLPALRLKKFSLFASAVSSVCNGGLKVREIERYGRDVSTLIAELEQAGGECVFMSSSGPAIAIIGKALDDIDHLLRRLDRLLPLGSTIIRTSAVNTGFELMEGL